jgi:hypothetical protein
LGITELWSPLCHLHRPVDIRKSFTTASSSDAGDPLHHQPIEKAVSSHVTRIMPQLLSSSKGFCLLRSDWKRSSEKPGHVLLHVAGPDWRSSLFRGKGGEDGLGIGNEIYSLLACLLLHSTVLHPKEKERLSPRLVVCHMGTLNSSNLPIWPSFSIHARPCPRSTLACKQVCRPTMS